MVSDWGDVTLEPGGIIFTVNGVKNTATAPSIPVSLVVDVPAHVTATLSVNGSQCTLDQPGSLACPIGVVGPGTIVVVGITARALDGMTEAAVLLPTIVAD